MTTFDLAEVRSFTADLENRLTRCDNGEGMECATLDAALQHYAEVCYRFAEEVRRWGREVFYGRGSFDPDTEMAWRNEGARLLSRAKAKLAYSHRAEIPCYTLDSKPYLQAALYKLDRLLSMWISPKLAVGPSARLGSSLGASTVAEAQARLSFLQPLPADWQPDDLVQQRHYRMLKNH